MARQRYPIAILQGRLSSDPEGRFQFFPTEWVKEFPLAQELGFAGIEWLIDPRIWRENPVFGRDRWSVLDRQGQDSVPVSSVCADWFMEVPLWEGDPLEHRGMLMRVIEAAEQTTERLVLVPLLEKHTVADPALQKRVVEVLKPLEADLARADVRIAFETELPAPALAAFVDSFGGNRFGVYYDTGNCTSYGFDCSADIRLLGCRVMGVHVKDRKIGTTQSVPLGQGDADFAGILRALREVGWHGTLVMQAWRGEHYLDDAASQKKFLDKIQQEILE